MPSVRRLAAILAADVAGYSRLMGADEEGTHERLKAHLGELVEPKIKEHRGRIVKNTGDGLLAEFASVVDAVRCAAEVQRAMADRNAETPEDKRITFRVGINLGDVIAEPDDIYGDGVNVAARLEALAEPGGICISRVVRDQIRDKLPYPFEDRGEQSVKNIARSVRVFALRPETIAELPAAGVPIAVPRRRRSVVAPIAAAVAAVLVIALIAWWLWPATRFSPTATIARAPATASTALTLVAPRLSIVVLPFANLSNDAEQQYFADGITEDLTTDLSRISHMLVISRNSAFTYKDKPVNARQIGRELGVRYLLEGSVQRSANQVRVTAQLIDVETDTHLWAERFDHDTGDLFALQNEITSRIAVALNAEVLAAEIARGSQDNPDALDYILQGRAALAHQPGLDSYSEAINSFEHALVFDPHSTEAKSWLANALVGRVLDLHPSSSWSDLKRADTLVSQALAASPRNPLAHFVKGQLLRVEGRCDEAIPEFEMVIASDRNSSGALFALGECKLLTGSIDEAIPLEEQAIRLDPRDPSVWNRYLAIGKVNLLQSRIEEAIVSLERARIGNPGSPWPHLWLASAYALKGETERAGAELAEARRLLGAGSFSSIAQVMAHGYWGVPKTRALFEATYLVGLRKAGLPEE
jgi:TolB-like protein/class 3 adenylate cyclase/Flp pilus assembly protein TadD